MKLLAQILILLSLCTISAEAQRKKTATKKQTVPQLSEEELRAKELFEEMLPNTQRVFVIDSTVTSRANVLDAIPLPTGYGKVVPYNLFFNTDSQPDAYVFVNGFGNRCYYSEADNTGRLQLYCKDRLGNAWGEAQLLENLGEDLTDLNYPFMSADGTTLYFAARSESSLGGYDIYVSTYDPDEGTFMKAENLGLPFNSTADDYLFVVDENDSLGWFATARKLAEDQVCVYTFVPSATRQNYNEDELDEDELAELANLTRIRSTWPTPEMRDLAVARAEALKGRTANQRAQAMQFVVNDDLIYNNVSNFSSQANRQAFESIVTKQEKMARTELQLADLREEYHKGNALARKRLSADIRQQEATLHNLAVEISQETKQLRNKENFSKNKR